MVAQPQTKIKMTAEDFFQLPETTRIEELINGELIVSPPAFVDHQFSSSSTLEVLLRLIEGGKLFHAPTAVCLDDENTPKPDIFWLALASMQKISKKCIEGAPDLIVEIFSPRTARRDRVTKYVLYQKHGVREYWMIDPVNEYIEVYRLENGAFVQQGIYEPGDAFESAVLGGKTVDVAALFA